MSTPQMGIFALGTSAHCYLELDAIADADAAAVVTAVAALDEPHASLGGVNLVVGLRPELWAAAAPGHAPDGVRGFVEPVRGVDGFEMPATQHDIFVWIAGSSQDVVFDVARLVLDLLRPVAQAADEVNGWAYQHNRDLTGFIDGTENPSLVEAPEVALVPDGKPGAGGSVVLVQKWVHHSDRWMALPVEEQELVMGRTKGDSVELDEDRMPEDSHVSRTVIEDADGEELEIFRRNTPYGGVRDHGTMFVGFSADQRRLARMLDRMAGVEGGVRDALTRYTSALTGSYYFCPSVDSLQAFRTES